MATTIIRNPTLEQTIAAMRQQANEAKKTLRPLAARICEGLEPGDYNSEIGALYAWVCQNIRYARDINNVEYVQSPARLIESKTGDCDDMACLLAALCMAMGNEARFVVVGFEDRQPTHVFCQVAIQTADAGGGNTAGEKLWVTVDPVAAENTPQMHSRSRLVKVYPVGSGSPGAGSFGNSGGSLGSGRGGVQTFSVFDPFSRSFTYYEAAGTAQDYGARGTKFRAPTQPPQGNKELGYIGFAPEALALPLPASAMATGQGVDARGIIAFVPRGAGSRSRSRSRSRGGGGGGGGGVNGLGGVDLTPPSLLAPTLGATDEVVTVKSSFTDMVLAASIAAVVGAFVQKAIRGKK